MVRRRVHAYAGEDEGGSNYPRLHPDPLRPRFLFDKDAPMTSNTNALRHRRAMPRTPGTALNRALALAEAAGDTERVAALRALWPALDRRRPTTAGAAWPRHRERRRIAPRLTIDDAMIEAWLGGTLPPR
jgi:hypothetical protein